MSDEYPFFAWSLRAEAFNRFGYDPDGVFAGSPVDDLGFVAGRAPQIIYSEAGADPRH
jgi:hypothetical protein